MTKQNKKEEPEGLWPYVMGLKPFPGKKTELEIQLTKLVKKWQ